MACRSSGSGSKERAFVSSRSMELDVAFEAAAAAAALAFFLAVLVFAADGSLLSLAFDRLGAGGAWTTAVDVEAPSVSAAAAAAATTTTAGTFGGFLARIRKLGNASKCSPVL